MLQKNEGTQSRAWGRSPRPPRPLSAASAIKLYPP